MISHFGRLIHQFKLDRQPKVHRSMDFGSKVLNHLQADADSEQSLIGKQRFRMFYSCTQTARLFHERAN